MSSRDCKLRVRTRPISRILSHRCDGEANKDDGRDERHRASPSGARTAVTERGLGGAGEAGAILPKKRSGGASNRRYLRMSINL